MTLTPTLSFGKGGGKRPAFARLRWAGTLARQFGEDRCVGLGVGVSASEKGLDSRYPIVYIQRGLVVL